MKKLTLLITLILLIVSITISQTQNGRISPPSSNVQSLIQIDDPHSTTRGFKPKSHGMHADPNQIATYKQPDGSEIKFRQYGNGAVNWKETVDGQTILTNSDEYFVYAIATNDGDLAPSNIRVSADGEIKSSEEINLRRSNVEKVFYSQEKISELKASYLPSPTRAGPSRAFPTSGTRNLLVLLIDYPDASNSYPSSNFDNMMNQAGYNGDGSFKDYYFENSYGQLTMNTTVVGWYTAANSHDWYGDVNGSARAQTLVGEAVDAAQAAGVDFSIYDNDGDGNVDGVMVIHQGNGAEQGDNRDIWSHSWALNGGARSYDGVTINEYTINPETSSGSMGTIGVLCHEFGHNLGAPDWYDTDYATGGQAESLGEWDVMDAGSYNGSPSGCKPAHHNVFTKEFYGWLTITELVAPQSVTMANMEQNPVAYKYTTTTANEYFVLENRQQVGFDASIPGSGLIIYHVDGSYVSSHWNTNDINALASHEGFELEEADDSGPSNAGDAFPGSTSQTQFDDATSPNSRSWASANTNKPLLNISNSGGNVSFCYISCSPPVADFVGVPTTVPQGGTVNFTDLSTGTPTSWAWDFGDPAAVGSTTAQNPSVVYNTIGNHRVQLTATNGSGNDLESKNNYITVVAATCSDGVQNGTETGIDCGGSCTACGPCGLVTPITCGVTQTYSNVGSGDWDDADGCYASPGKEQIYSIVAPVTGTYSIEVTSTNGKWLDYGWKASSCSLTGWKCIKDVMNAGTYDGTTEDGPMSWTAGTTYYLVLDAESVVLTTHDFYIDCPTPKTINTITYNQASTVDVYRTSNENEILRIDFDVTGTVGTLPLNSLQVTSNNISDADIAANGVKLYTTTTTTFSTANPLGTAQSLSGGVATFNGLNYDLPTGVTYVWVVYDIDAGATVGNTVDALIATNDIDVDGTTYPGSDESPAGTRTIISEPCGNIIPITCGVSQTFTSGGTGLWANPDGCNSSSGKEQIYSIVAPFTGTYNIEVTSTGGTYMDYAWQASSCAEAGWTCIGRVSTTGTKSNMSWIAGTTYYIILDDENTTTSTHQFYIDCPQLKSINSIIYNQASTVDVYRTSNDNEILRIDFDVIGTEGTLPLNSLQVTSNNIADADIAANGVKLYRTTTTTFSTANLLGTAQSFSGGLATFNGLNYDLPTGMTYVWVVYDIDAGATAGNTVDAIIATNDIDVDGTTYPGSDESPAGTRTIISEPCGNIIPITCGVSQTFTSGGAGFWANPDGCNSSSGKEQIYSIVAPLTGTYNIEVTSTGGYVDYAWQASSCAEAGWTCIGRVSTTGTKSNMSWTAGTTYYIILDDENTTASTHQFYIDCPQLKSINSIIYNQASTVDVYRTSNDNEILRIDFDVIGTVGTLPLNSLQVTSNNIADADIAANGVKLYRTTTTTFSTANLLGTAQSFSGGLATFNGLNYDLPTGMTYVWVVYDIDAGATVGNTVDAIIATNDIDVDGTTYPGSDESPAGTRTIISEPCGNIIPITCGVSQTFTSGGAGLWANPDGCNSSSGKEQIYSIVAPLTGTYNIEVTSTGGYVDYAWQASSCAEAGWTCIGRVSTTGTKSDMSWTAGTTYYIILDDENTTASTHQFYIDCPQLKSLNSITYVQASTADVLVSTSDNKILRIGFDVTGTAGTLPLNSIQLTSNNIDDADIPANGVKLYWTTTTTFSTANLLGTAQSFSGGLATFSGFNYDLPTGMTYVWVAYDIAAGATSANTVDAIIATNDIDVDGTTYPASDESPAGNRMIRTAYGPCGLVIPLTCGVTGTYTSGGSGDWANADGCFLSPGTEQIYSIIAPATGTYTLEVTSTDNTWVDYGWKASSCSSTSWNCITDLRTTGTYDGIGEGGPMSWTAGTTYYLVVDDEDITASTHEFYINCPISKTLNSITYNQASTADLYRASNDNEILRIDFDVIGTGGTLPLNSLQVTSNNIADADIAANGVKLYWTSTTTFSTDNLLETAQSLSGSVATFNGLSYELPAGMTYVWVVYDIDAAATIGNTVDALIAANDIDVSGTTYPGSDESPAGTRPIVNGPCENAIAITCGVIQTYTSGGAGIWTNVDGSGVPINPAGCDDSPGVEQVYSFVAPFTGTYNIEVTSADASTLNYAWQENNCDETSWTCIDAINATGTYGALSWTAGTTYYIMLDDENTTASTHEFYIDCPTAKVLTSITYNQASINDVPIGGSNKEILRIDFTVEGTLGTLDLNSLVVTSNNITDADIAANGVKLYTTTVNSFSTANLLGTAQSFSGGTATFNALAYDLPTGTSYVWVAYNIAATATALNTVDALIAANDIDVDGTTYPGSDESPAGSRLIVATGGEDCSTPLVIGSLPYNQTSMTTAGFGSDYDRNDACGSYYLDGDDFIFEYTPAVDECVNIDLTNTDEWVGVFVFDGCPDNPSTNCVADANDGQNGNPSLNIVQLTGGITYYIGISTNDPPQSTPFDINIETTACPVGPGADCGDPYIIASLPFSETGMNTAGFGDDYNSTHACNNTSYLNGDDFVFSYTPAVDECIEVVLHNTALDGIGLFAYDNCVLDNADCMTYVKSGVEDVYIPNLPVTGGVTYYFIVSSDGSPQNTPFDIEVNTVTCIDLSNDDCPTAITLVQNELCDPTPGSYLNAQDLYADCAETGKEDVWYKFVATTSTPIVAVYGTEDYYIELFSGSCAGSSLQCDKGQQITTSGLTIGNTYYVKASPEGFHFDYTFDICVFDLLPADPCASNPPADDLCGSATLINNLDGFCGNTSSSYGIDEVQLEGNPFCGSIDNNSWLSFIADSVAVQLSIYTSSCTAGEGIQMQIYETPDCNTFTPVSTCWDPAYETNGIVMADGLTVGNTYHLMIDGWNGDDCDYVISAPQGSGVQLPIELVSFSCNKYNGNTTLYWETASENNNDYFEIERSDDGQFFVVVDVVQGAGNSNELIEYQWEDRSTSEKQYYYRLKQYDYDGHYSNSDITICRESNNNLNGLTYNYNQDDNTIEVYFMDENSNQYNLVVYDCVGKLIVNERLSGSKVRYKVQLPEISKGIYYMNINGYDGNVTEKILKY